MGGIIRHAKTVLIRQKGDDMKVFMWNVHKVPVRCACGMGTSVCFLKP